ncbi:hypothetical protein PTSG_07625 [Salpingoeca rosetta]|uniref:Spindle pole body component n=1 Tax=Salpingoeca rosetta (strain ATCC 50818 / BSB-021) TaxID=946362 RepID=F2UHA9_SALR5|nr:uncharacterized protein PTSG_07625 [Salpingoeca rosetta]EGD76508.1 hypothetical protein PTSG_07625 [Salpingoeca rosetta]|eukprot:XP_004991422.1 hypothetical protein PTSG_07625 [Salpingoeca rosetta]
MYCSAVQRPKMSASRFRQQTEARVQEALQQLAQRVCEQELTADLRRDDAADPDADAGHAAAIGQRRVLARALVRHVSPNTKRMLAQHSFLDVNEQYVERRYAAVAEKFWINGHMQLASQLQASVANFLSHSLDGVSREPTREHYSLLMLLLELANNPMHHHYQPSAQPVHLTTEETHEPEPSPLEGLQLYINGTRPIESQPTIPELEEMTDESDSDEEQQHEQEPSQRSRHAGETRARDETATEQRESLSLSGHTTVDTIQKQHEHEQSQDEDEGVDQWDMDIDLAVFTEFAHAAARRRMAETKASESPGAVERRVVMDICAAMQGCTRVTVLEYNRETDTFHLPHTLPPLPTISAAATRRLLGRLLHTTNAIHALRRICAAPPAFDESPVASAIANAASTIVAHWHAAVTDISQRCMTLLAVSTAVRQTSRGLLDLSRLVVGLRQQHWVTSLNMLDRLAGAWTRVRGPLHHQRLSHSSASPAATALLNAIPFVYAEACRPVLASAYLWLLRGQALSCLPIRIATDTNTSSSSSSSKLRSGRRVTLAQLAAEQNQRHHCDGTGTLTSSSSSSPALSSSSSPFTPTESSHVSSSRIAFELDGETFWRQDVQLADNVPALLADCAAMLVEAGKATLLLMKLHEWRALTQLSRHPDLQLLRSLGEALPVDHQSSAPPPSSSSRDGGDGGGGPDDEDDDERHDLVWRAVAMASGAVGRKTAHEGLHRSSPTHVQSVFFFQQLLHRCVLYAHRMTNTALLACFRERLHLNKHLHALRDFFLMYKGDLALQWVDIVTQHLSRGGNANLCTLDLEDACAVHAPFLNARLNVSFLEPTNENALSGVHIEYKVDPVLTMLITPAHMKEYNAIHQTLLLLKQARWTLENLSFRRDFEMGAVSHGCMIVRARLLYFVRVLDEYTMHRALAEPSKTADQQLMRANTIEDIHRIHSTFVATVKRRVLLPGTLQLYVLNLLNAALKFGLICRAKIDRLSELQRAEMDSYRAVKALVKVLESADARRFPHVSALGAQLSGGDQWRSKFQRVL